MFTDTAKASITSKRGNRYSQLFSLPIGWVRAFGIPKKSDAHDALSLLFKREGVPTTMVMDGSKEQTLGEFKTKCRQAGCHVNKQNITLPGATLVKLLSKKLS